LYFDKGTTDAYALVGGSLRDSAKGIGKREGIPRFLPANNSTVRAASGSEEMSLDLFYERYLPDVPSADKAV
jgi:hypothetical protein